jgi:hypothetical protein
MRARRRRKNGILPYFIIATGLGILYYFYKNTSSPSLPSSGQDSSGPLPSPAPSPSPTNPSGDSGADSDSGYQ